MGYGMVYGIWFFVITSLRHSSSRRHEEARRYEHATTIFWFGLGFGLGFGLSFGLGRGLDSGSLDISFAQL